MPGVAHFPMMRAMPGNISSPLERLDPITVIGWREWVSLPDLGIATTKAKIDTGARSSSLHAIDQRLSRRDGVDWVSFEVHPLQRRDDFAIACEAPVHDRRRVRSSSGAAQWRYVVRTRLHWMGLDFDVDLTLADRTVMGFRMLIGREAIRGHLLVDPGRSYFGPRPSRSLRHPPASSPPPLPS